MSKFVLNIIKKWQLILYISLMLSAVTFFVSTAITPKYKSDITILIIQKNVDTLTASQDAKYLSDVFEKILYTESFMRGVLKSDAEIKREFSKNANERAAEWKNEIVSKKVGNSGILKISVFDPSSQDSYKIAIGIVKNFKENSKEYFGQKDEIEIKIIDGPIASSKVAHPNTRLNVIIAFIAGFFGSLLIVYFFKDFDLRLIKRSKGGLLFSLDSSEKTIERKIGDQLVRQLEKRKDNIALEYLDKQVEEQDDLEISRSIVQRKVEETLNNEDIETQQSSLYTSVDNELEYIDIPMEEDFDKKKDEFIYIEDGQAHKTEKYADDSEVSPKESLESFNVENESQEAPELKEEIVETETEKQGGDNFWENMRTIDEAAVSSEAGIKDNPLLADSMIDIDMYHKIIKAGETFKGFKDLREQNYTDKIEKDDFNVSDEDIEDNFEQEQKQERDFNDKVEEVERLRRKEQEDELELDLPEIEVKKEEVYTDQESRKDNDVAAEEIKLEEAEELELTAVGLKKLKESQKIPQKNQQDQESEKIAIEEEIDLANGEIEQIESMEPIGYIKKEQEPEVPEILVENEDEFEMQESEEDFDEIVEEKREKEKEEIKRLLAEELDKKDGVDSESTKTVAKDETELFSGEKTTTTTAKKEEELEEEEAIESMNYIGSADEEIESEDLEGETTQYSTAEKSKEKGAFARLYEKSIFSDEKYKEQKAKNTTHHMEMDPEELEMMRKMLRAEGKSEEEFVMENGLIDEGIAQNLKKVENEQKFERDKEIPPRAEILEPIEESVKKIEMEDIPQKSGKKSYAPSNLPIFMEEENEQDAFARRLLETKVSEKNTGDQKIQNQIVKKINPDKEVSEEEIKEKLNRLLQGEL